MFVRFLLFFMTLTDEKNKKENSKFKTNKNKRKIVSSRKKIKEKRKITIRKIELSFDC